MTIHKSASEADLRVRSDQAGQGQTIARLRVNLKGVRAHGELSDQGHVNPLTSRPSIRGTFACGQHEHARGGQFQGGMVGSIATGLMD